MNNTREALRCNKPLIIFLFLAIVIAIGADHHTTKTTYKTDQTKVLQ